MQGFTALMATVGLLAGIAVGYLVRRYWAVKQFGGVEEKITVAIRIRIRLVIDIFNVCVTFLALPLPPLRAC